MRPRLHPSGIQGFVHGESHSDGSINVFTSKTAHVENMMD